MKIALASDHGGLLLKNHLVQYLVAQSYETLDFGPIDEQSVDYPLFAKKVALAIQLKQATFGVLICSTGVGISIAANRFMGVRAVNCNDEFIAKMSREHNNANIICFGQKTVAFNAAERMLNIFLKTSFSLDVRHTHRVRLIDEAK